MFKRVRYYIFLKDVLILALSAFGGPQAHLAMFLDLMVTKRGYLSETDLIELNALCQILPGPTSTQTITAIGFKIGGPNLAYLTLLVWMTPAVLIMTIMAIFIAMIPGEVQFTQFIQPMAVGFVSFAAYRISNKVVNTKTGIVIMIAAAVSAFYIRTPFLFPVLLLFAGATTAFKYKAQPIEEKSGLKIKWGNFLLWGGVFIVAALLGSVTKSFPVIVTFENFYRNGSLIFGGGDVLIPLLYTEFVEYKKLLEPSEFLSGYAMVRGIPGPVFSFSSYIGAMSMETQGFGVGGQIAGAIFAAMGIFLPGTFLIFFVIRFWESLKKYRIVKASLEGISAASSGMVVAAAILMFQPLENNFQNFGITIGTFCLLAFTKIPAPFIILTGLIAGIFI
ncbi:MAG: chromate efflux transporter [Bacteroidota bacterium]